MKLLWEKLKELKTEILNDIRGDTVKIEVQAWIFDLWDRHDVTIDNIETAKCHNFIHDDTLLSRQLYFLWLFLIDLLTNFSNELMITREGIITNFTVRESKHHAAPEKDDELL